MFAWKSLSRRPFAAPWMRFSSSSSSSSNNARRRFVYFEREPTHPASTTNRRRLLFAVASTAVAGGYYYTHLETVPISGRSRFMSVSIGEEESMAKASYNEVINQFRMRILPHRHPLHRMVERVAERIVKVSGMEALDWEINVINSEEVNAFVLPGGKIFVFTGILKVTENDDQLAAVLGHEIAHQMARHSAEKLSLFKLAFVAKFIASFLFDPSFLFNSMFFNLGIHLPFSRKCESEADYIGLLLMAQACYNPRESVRFWERMAQVHKGQGSQFLSTHPSHSSRSAKLTEWMPEARQKFESSDCDSHMVELERMFVAFPDFRVSKW